MAYDDELADRVRELLDARDEVGPVVEKRMFGGLAFMVRGHMALCVSGQGGLLMRTDPDETARLLALDGVGPMQMGAQQSATWIRVAPDVVEAVDDLATWVERGVGSVIDLPPR